MNCYKRVSMLGQECLYNASNEKRKDNVCAWGGEHLCYSRVLRYSLLCIGASITTRVAYRCNWMCVTECV